ncbi:DUF2298 domain-containing protein [Haladaptatus sp. YSMS36]|uniref:DUF2298 domain-containing protein n=1 Tax=Haladaptatus sp. YSMS36 TaxID=3033384 RepID=UPI0023E8AB06|nr:DUF2298 domain-containing protein [Haladaptatus sp. YSMS36]
MEVGLVALWLAVYLSLWALSMPLAALIFDRVADRGAGLALPLGLGIMTLTAYWVGHLAFGWVALAAGLIVLVAGSAFALSRGVEVGWRDRIDVPLLFTLAFLFIIVVRGADPGVWPGGGEKFLDFGLLKTLLRSPVLPPEDFWYAGEPVRYYYGGHLISALLTILTGTETRFAYNLALAGFYGMLLTAAYSVAGMVAGSFDVSRRTAGLFAVFFVGFASNILTGLQVLVWALPDAIGGPLGQAIAANLHELAAEKVVAPPSEFAYWHPSRVIPGTINEFPFFAWLNGDLHAHMMSTPFLLLGAGLLFAYFRTPEREVTRRRLLVFGAIPPLAGFIAVVNTWSFPTIVGLTWLSVAFAPARPLSLLPTSVVTRAERLDSPITREGSRLGGALGVALLVLVGGLLWTLPFWLGTASGRSIGFFPERSPLAGLLVVHGAFLAVFVPYLLAHVKPEIKKHAAQTGVVLALFVPTAWLGGLAAIAVFAPLLVVGWVLLRLRDDLGYETVLLLAGLGLVLIVEFAFVQEDAAPGRFNTVFKVYMQVWVLWSVAASIMLARLLGGGRAIPTSWRKGTAVLAALLVVSTSFYGAFALAGHFDDGATDDMTLDSLQYVSDYHASEVEAIHWLDEKEGQPHIIEAPGRAYRWSNAPSALTGLPTVLGWTHEIGYRGQAAYDERLTDVTQFYTGTPEQQVAILEQYDVRYIYVGPQEREAYDPGDFSRLSGVSVAYESSHVTIYEVDQNQLAAS